MQQRPPHSAQSPCTPAQHNKLQPSLPRAQGHESRSILPLET